MVATRWWCREVTAHVALVLTPRHHGAHVLRLGSVSQLDTDTIDHHVAHTAHKPSVLATH